MATHELTLKAAVERHPKHDRSLSGTAEYALMCSDGSGVVSILRGPTPFTLCGYQEDLELL